MYLTYLLEDKVQSVNELLISTLQLNELRRVLWYVLNEDR